MPQQQQLLMQQLFQLPQQQLLFQQLSQLQPQQQMLFLLQLQQQQLQNQFAGLPLDDEKVKQSLMDPNLLQSLAQSLAYSYQATSMFPFLSQQFGMGLGLNLGNDALNAAALYSVAAAAQANNFFLNKKTPIMMDTSNASSLLHHPSNISSSLKCPEPNCNKVFTRAYNLKSHQLSHSGVRPYQCR